MGAWQHEVGGEVAAAPSAVWALWADAAQWPRWNPGIARARMDGPLRLHGTARVRFRGSLAPLTFRVVEVDEGRSFTDEARLPGARLGHVHRVEPRGDRAHVTHRLYLAGPLAAPWARLLGARMREGAAGFVALEDALAREAAPGGTSAN
jgi:uncharacterized protein YndB with AHSA1/START domain